MDFGIQDLKVGPRSESWHVAFIWIGNFPISFPYHSHTSRDSYGSSMGGWGSHLLRIPRISLDWKFKSWHLQKWCLEVGSCGRLAYFQGLAVELFGGVSASLWRVMFHGIWSLQFRSLAVTSWESTPIKYSTYLFLRDQKNPVNHLNPLRWFRFSNHCFFHMPFLGPLVLGPHLPRICVSFHSGYTLGCEFQSVVEGKSYHRSRLKNYGWFNAPPHP